MTVFKLMERDRLMATTLNEKIGFKRPPTLQAKGVENWYMLQTMLTTYEERIYKVMKLSRYGLKS